MNCLRNAVGINKVGVKLERFLLLGLLVGKKRSGVGHDVNWDSTF
jgi:hypothetical protein